MKSRWKIFVLSLCFVGPAQTAPTTPARMLCIFDVVGSQGDAFNLMKNYQLEAMKAGVTFQMRAFQNENEAVKEFRAGQCDLLAVSDLPAREFNSFTGSVSAIGAVPLYGDLKILMHSLADRRMASKLGNPQYQILGVVPLGGTYLFVNDKNIDTVDKLKGKRIAVLENHQDATQLIRHVEAIPVQADITTFANLFKTGKVDISYAPAAAYEVLEMSQGMGDKGGIIRYPLGQFTLQLIARTGTFDDEFIKLSRRTMSDLYDTAMAIIMRYEMTIPKERWVDLPDDAIDGYQEMLRGVRVQMSNAGDNKNVYHPDMLRLLRKIRCHTDPGAIECTATDKE